MYTQLFWKVPLEPMEICKFSNYGLTIMIRRTFGAATLMGGLMLLATSFTGVATAADGDKLFPDLINADGSDAPVHPNIGEGKWTLVMMWATTCHICEIDKPLMSELHKKHKDGNIEVFGISVDGPKEMPAVQSYLAKRDVSFPNSVGDIITVNSSMINITQESFRGTPTYLLFNPEGEIKAVQAGHLNPEVVEKFVASNS